MNECIAIMPGTTLTVCGGNYRHWYHDKSDHRDCDVEECIYHKYKAPAEVAVESIDLTPSWKSVILLLAEAYVNGSAEARVELLRVADIADNMRGKATK